MPEPTVLVFGTTALTARCIDFVQRSGTARIEAVILPDDKSIDDVDPALQACVRESGLDVVAAGQLVDRPGATGVSIGYPAILPATTLDLFGGGVLNLHLAPLPWYRGALTSLSMAVLHGVEEFGVTLHVMDAGIDTGPILRRRDFPLPRDRTVAELMPLLLEEAYELFCEAFPAAVTGGIVAVPQAQWPGYSKARSVLYKRDALDGMHELADLVDLQHVDRLVRALSWDARSRPFIRTPAGNRLEIGLVPAGEEHRDG